MLLGGLKLMTCILHTVTRVGPCTQMRTLRLKAQLRDAKASVDHEKYRHHDTDHCAAGPIKRVVCRALSAGSDASKRAFSYSFDDAVESK
jgi:hypothetical protein